MYDNSKTNPLPIMFLIHQESSAIPFSVNLALVKLCIRVFNKVLSRGQKLWSRRNRKRLMPTAWVSKGVQWSATPPKKIFEIWAS